MSGNRLLVLVALSAAGFWNLPMAVAAGNPCAGSVGASATDTESRGPVHFESSKVTVDIQKGKGGTSLAAGFNDLTKQTLECSAPGVLIFALTLMAVLSDHSHRPLSDI